MTGEQATGGGGGAGGHGVGRRAGEKDSRSLEGHPTFPVAPSDPKNKGAEVHLSVRSGFRLIDVAPKGRHSCEEQESWTGVGIPAAFVYVADDSPGLRHVAG